ncbi:MAG: hypothetical protein C4519_12530 [Desulfobacteraceae bacterium]|nr:MAG: hypothetical protein C4519_12530 [Desulfobacteraceae bacterium]
MNLDKQIKRHVIGRRHHFFAVAAPAMEALAAREVNALSDSVDDTAVETGGVLFSGRLEDLYRANLHLRTAGRILLRLSDFKATNFRQLEKKTAATAWVRYLPAGAVPACKAAAHQSRLYHSQAVAQAVQQAIRAYWQALEIPARDDRGQTLYVRLDQDAVRLSLDSSGANLYRRGFKTHIAAAPLRETLAAAVLQLAGYDPARPLLDPMCGSGTFALEAALMAKQIPPGYRREFAFMQWPSFRPARWQHLKNTAAKQIRPLERPLIHASDIDPEACRRLAGCVRANNLCDAIAVSRADFFALAPPPGSAGLIVLNPPYGRRLPPEQPPETFYGHIAAKLARDFKGWQVAWIVPRADLLRGPLGLKPLHLTHGGLSLTLLIGSV